MKRGSLKAQTTIFIILAIVIITIIGSTTYTINKSKKINLDEEYFSNIQIKSSFNNLKTEILNCLDESTEISLKIIKLQGGYYDKPEYAFETELPPEENQKFIPYYYHETLILNPTKSEVEKELSKAVIKELTNCLEKIETQNFNLDYKTLKTDTKILNKEVKFTVISYIQIEKENHIINFELIDHPVLIESKLNDILDLASYMTESRKDDPLNDCISCIAKLAEEKDLYVYIENFEELTTVVAIYDLKTEDELFVYLNKFKEENE